MGSFRAASDFGASRFRDLSSGPSAISVSTILQPTTPD